MGAYQNLQSYELFRMTLTSAYMLYCLHITWLQLTEFKRGSFDKKGVLL